MVDACGLIEIGNQNMFGPDVYITDSNHRYGPGLAPNEQPMDAVELVFAKAQWQGRSRVNRVTIAGCWLFGTCTDVYTSIQLSSIEYTYLPFAFASAF